ncbi:hypothetical protein SISNIDRAFT_355573 [Sistotremastrum niveocremeum HHB9708]|uniref:Uncharacterized protein n=1 Tax=Sistotremastrum niveocremeum HHB9708 TaxID=1314777 RepID=A0A164MDI9_9AGAM|nr:hypothetical protein SISNIDRAFT_355573 [Sistotremastrum niveocremeum HHB9708]
MLSLLSFNNQPRTHACAEHALMDRNGLTGSQAAMYHGIILTLMGLLAFQWTMASWHVPMTQGADMLHNFESFPRSDKLRNSSIFLLPCSKLVGNGTSYLQCTDHEIQADAQDHADISRVHKLMLVDPIPSHLRNGLVGFPFALFPFLINVRVRDLPKAYFEGTISISMLMRSSSYSSWKVRAHLLCTIIENRLNFRRLFANLPASSSKFESDAFQ